LAGLPGRLASCSGVGAAGRFEGGQGGRKGQSGRPTMGPGVVGFFLNGDGCMDGQAFAAGGGVWNGCAPGGGAFACFVRSAPFPP